ncbi:hypothetical protein UFOVP672_19 [uncultured Caudovirales phage]|uniref:Uncharacterized protein n=1 Tax=uncultured Caudovirales phage TaxID=2100421 RepID=A0A6J5NC93_9CAUD|nr:hypothetical protein UFOVP672_19 [uncultured Caudovirales phage]
MKKPEPMNCGCLLLMSGWVFFLIFLLFKLVPHFFLTR